MDIAIKGTLLKDTFKHITEMTAIKKTLKEIKMLKIFSKYLVYYEGFSRHKTFK